MNVRRSHGIVSVVFTAMALVPGEPACAQLGDPLDEGRSRPPLARARGTVTVTTSPSGAVVRLDGQGIHLVGRTPWTISRGLDGIYTLRSHLDVHESASATVFLSPATNETIHMDLAPKTPFKAAIRSVLVPGWGQHYSGRDASSGAYFGSAVAATVFLTIKAVRYEQRVNDVEAAHRDYVESMVQAEREELWKEVERRRLRADDAHRERAVAWAILGVVWGVNLLDSLFFFPDARPAIVTSSMGAARDTGLFVEPRAGGANVGLQASY